MYFANVCILPVQIRRPPARASLSRSILCSLVRFVFVEATKNKQINEKSLSKKV